jgi:hypothetical protein
MNMGLHSFDLFFYLNADTLEFLWGDYRRCVAGVVAALAVALNLEEFGVSLKIAVALLIGGQSG